MIGFHLKVLDIGSLILLLCLGFLNGCSELDTGDRFIYVHGTVVERASKEPIDSASVTIDPDLDEPYTRTDSLGRFLLELLAPPDSIMVYAGRDGYGRDSVVLRDLNKRGYIDSLVLQLEPL